MSSVPSENYESYLVPSRYSMQQRSYTVQQIHGSSLRMRDELPIGPPVQHTVQYLYQAAGSGDQIVWVQQPEQPAAQPQQIEQQQRVGVREDVLVVQSERPLYGLGKPRIHWTQELHARFVRAVSELGGSFRATPKGIQRKMNVIGLTREHIKSHLQKFRTNNARRIRHQGLQNSVNSRSLQLSAGQGSRSSAAPVNGNGLEFFDADIQAYGNLLQSYENQVYDQNLMFAPMGGYQQNANGSGFGI